MGEASAQRRLTLDKFGFPRGRYLAHDEDWSSIGIHTGTVAALGVGRWTLNSSNADGAVRTVDAGTAGSSLITTGLKLLLPKTANNDRASIMQTAIPVVADADTLFTMEADSFLVDQLNNSAILFGLADTDGAGSGIANIVTGAFIYKAAADSTWKYRSTKDSTDTSVDSGVTAVGGAAYRLRVELEGTAAARFYINGAARQTITTNLPFSAASTRAIRPVIVGITETTGGAAVSIYVGPTHFRQANIAAF